MPSDVATFAWALALSLVVLAGYALRLTRLRRRLDSRARMVDAVQGMEEEGASR